jgi:hypothetical protein
MHDILIALVFVGMVACPAIVSAVPVREAEAVGKQRTLSLAPVKSKRLRPADAATATSNQ